MCEVSPVCLVLCGPVAWLISRGCHLLIASEDFRLLQQTLKVRFVLVDQIFLLQGLIIFVIVELGLLMLSIFHETFDHVVSTLGTL
jgi:hypothetical protein